MLESRSAGMDAVILFLLYSMGRAGPGVDSGSQFDGCFGAVSREDAVRMMKDRAKSNAVWLISRRNPDTDEVYRIDREVVTELLIDGVKHDMNQSAGLTEWM